MSFLGESSGMGRAGILQIFVRCFTQLIRQTAGWSQNTQMPPWKLSVQRVSGLIGDH